MPAGPRPTGVFVRDPTAGDRLKELKKERPAGIKHYAVSGRVLAPDGQPAAGCDVYWEGIYQRNPNQFERRSADRFAQTKTDAEGRFACEADFDAVHVPFSYLVFRHADYGLRSHTISLSEELKPIEVRFEETYPIEGTIFTPNGEPVKDAQVYLAQINHYPGKESKRAGTESWGMSLNEADFKSGKLREYWPAAAKTDADGRFRFANLVARTATADVLVFAKDFAPTKVHVAGPDSERYDPTFPFREPTFTLVLEQSYLVEGRYTDEKSGEPIEGVRIEVRHFTRRGNGNMDFVEATSDADGRYSLRLGSADTFGVHVDPPLGYPGIHQMFSSDQVERLAGPGRKINYPIKLRRGVLLRGKVVDKQSGDGVAGAEVGYRLASGRKIGINTDFEPVKTAADGSFEVTGIDGKGFLLVDAPDLGFYRLEVKNDSLQSYNGAYFPHGVAELDVPADGQKEPITIELHRGPELVAKVVDPAGKPVKQLRALWVGQTMGGYTNGQTFRDGTLRIGAVDPAKTYRVFLFSEDADAGLVTDLTAPADGKPLEVRLEPCGKIRGRYVYSPGVGVPELTNFSHFRFLPKREDREFQIFDLPFYDNFTALQEPKRTSDAEGYFELNGIVPGVEFYLGLNYNFADGKNYYEIGALAPGEIKEMGEVQVKPN